MREKGFAYTQDRVAPATVRLWAYGLLPGDSPVTSSAEPTDEDEASSSDDGAALEDPNYVTALFGGPTNDSERHTISDDTGRQVGFVSDAGGCLGEAQSALFGGAEGYRSFVHDDLLIQTLYAEEESAFWESDATQDALTSFFDCIEEAGYTPTGDLSAPIAYADNATPDDTSSEAELKCKTRTGLLKLIFPLHAKSQADFVDQYSTLLERYTDWVARLEGAAE